MQIETLALLELRDTPSAYNALDAMVKVAPIELVRVVTVNPGKTLVIVTGDVASVESALDAGVRQVGTSLMDSFLLPYVHPEVVAALRIVPRGETVTPDSLGLFDAATVASGIEAADRAVKTADLRILSLRFDDSMGGRCAVYLSGLLNEVQAGMDEVREYLVSKDQLVREVIIPNPHPDMIRAFTASGTSQQGGS